MDSEILSSNPEPNWFQITQAIRNCDAVFLIITGGITRQEHTQNWVAFEVGVAAALDKPVIAVRAESNTTVAIPYVNHYYSYTSTNPPPHWEKRLDKQFWSSHFGLMIRAILSDRNHDSPFPRTTCHTCKSNYYYHGPEDPFR